MNWNPTFVADESDAALVVLPSEVPRVDALVEGRLRLELLDEVCSLILLFSHSNSGGLALPVVKGKLLVGAVLFVSRTRLRLVWL